MKERPTFTFRLPSPQYRRMLDFIAADEKTTPGKVLSRFIYCHSWDVMDKQASIKAHEKLAIGSGIPIEAVSWVRGSHTADWQKLADAIGVKKASEYQKKFLPLHHELIEEIDKAAGLDYSNLERRYELSEEE
jgi:hypothetical protein